MKKGLLCLLALSGCVSFKTMAANQASYDHQCPSENIKVLSFTDDGHNIELDVCGKVRRYRDMTPQGAEGIATWLDVTKQVKD